MTTETQRQELCFSCIKPVVFFLGYGEGRADSHVSWLVQVSEGRTVIAGLKHGCVSAGVFPNNLPFL